MRQSLILTGIILLLCPAIAGAATINVPADQRTIQAGIEAAAPGDIVLVAAGTYEEIIDFRGKAITVVSSGGPSVTIIDGLRDGSTVNFRSGETATSVFEGFRVINGIFGGIVCESSSPVIRDCVVMENSWYGIKCFDSSATITGCSAIDNFGNGIYLNDFTGLVENCIAANNSKPSYGGGISILPDNTSGGTTDCDIISCIVAENRASLHGGGINVRQGSTARITDCLIVYNVSSQSGGGCHFDNSNVQVTMTGCTVAHNDCDTSVNTDGVRLHSDTDFTMSNCILSANETTQLYGHEAWHDITYCDVDGQIVAGVGNISDDPLFSVGPGGDYYLSQVAAGQFVDSPCVDSGDPGSTLPGGTTRTDAVADTGVTDMGYHFPLDAGASIAGPPSSFDFAALDGGDSPLSQTLQIRLDGWGMMAWSVSDDADWLELEPASGFSYGETDEVQLAVDQTGLPLGQYSATLTIEAPGAVNSPLLIPVTLDVVTPALASGPVSLSFTADLGGGAPDNRSLGIQNAGGGTLNWSVSDDAGWLTLAPTSGASTGEIDWVTASVDSAGLPAGLHTASITIDAPGAAPSAMVIPVSFSLYSGQVVRVPQDHGTIQAAIDAAAFGDTVLLADGTYTGNGNRDLDLYGKALTLSSENGPDLCRIDCQGSEADPHRGIRFHSDEGPDAVLEGLTILGGHVPEVYGFGGGVRSIDAFPTIIDCRITDCYARYGGGIACDGGAIVLAGCEVVGNDFVDFGGGIFLENASATISDTVVADNGLWDWDDQMFGGGLYVTKYPDELPDPEIDLNNVLFTGNFAKYGAGLYARKGAFTMVNCTVADNEYSYGGSDFQLDRWAGAPLASMQAVNSIIWDEIDRTNYESLQADYCDILGGWPGTANFDLNPQFATGPQGGYYLSQLAAGQGVDSPCVDAGHLLAADLCHDSAGETICMGDLPTRTDEVSDSGQVDLGYHSYRTGWATTIGCSFDCTPTSGTVPFQVTMNAELINYLDYHTRRVAAKINVALGGGGYFANWRAGYTNIGPGDSYISGWVQAIPGLGSVLGDNTFSLVAEDVTPAPYNQPPYAPAGDTDSAQCVVTAAAP